MTTTSPVAADLSAAVTGLVPELTALRRALHQIPELGYEEVRTAERVRAELDAAGIEYKAGLAGGTGIVAYLPATRGGSETVALRADMDALPIAENTGAAWASGTPGKMHACGHDGHMTILLGAAKALAKMDRPNNVTFVFQPAEEGGAGGERMCADGALKGAAGGGIGKPVDRIFGLHGWPEQDLGTIGTRGGPLLAATDEFEITIHGTQGHAAFPHFAKDPVVCAAQVITALQTLPSRETDPVDSSVVTVGSIHGGSAHNVIPASVELIGTVRTLKDETRTTMRTRLHELVNGLSQAMGCRAEIAWHEGYPVTHNSAELAEKVLEVGSAALGTDCAVRIESPFMGGEDFSYYGHQVPACFFTLGLKPEGAGAVPLLHQAEFDFNDDAIGVGVEMFCRLVTDH
ncbi:MAG: amidohydrolase [Planctomycetota bacterium]